MAIYREYTVRRLKRDRPDLAELVFGGAMSANAAAIAAGFRQRKPAAPAEHPPHARPEAR